MALPLAGEAAQTCRTDTQIPTTTPAERFTVHGDGTVTDIQTGLMWAECTVGLYGAGCATGAVFLYVWEDALNLAAGSELAGHTDWRLPNAKELLSIIEERCYSCSRLGILMVHSQPPPAPRLTPP